MPSGLSETTTLPESRKILSVSELKVLNVRSNLQGLIRLTGHLIVMIASGYLWSHSLDNWFLALAMLVIYGFSLASMFL